MRFNEFNLKYDLPKLFTIIEKKNLNIKFPFSISFFRFLCPKHSHCIYIAGLQTQITGQITVNKISDELRMTLIDMIAIRINLFN